MMVQVNTPAPAIVVNSINEVSYMKVNGITPPFILKANGINERLPYITKLNLPQANKVNVTIVKGPKGEQGGKGIKGLSGTDIECTAGENLVSHQPICLVGGLAYKMDHLNPLHQFSFIGFSKTSAVADNLVSIETVKIELTGWGLLPNQTYMAGPSGGLITANDTLNSFSKIVGFAQSATSMLIVKDYTSINKL